MLVIRVVSFKGRPLGRELVARLGEAGGTIGRGEHSTLVLPDPDRYISRTHATISFQAGGFVITDTSTKNPIFLNGRPMGAGSQTRLGDGTEIKLGDYVLEVTIVARDVPPTPASGAAEPRSGDAQRDDPFAGLRRSQERVPDPFADLVRPAGPVTPRQEASPSLPEDPFGPLPGRPPTAPARPASSRSDPLADLQGPEPNVDEILGLKRSPVPDLVGPGLPPESRRQGAAPVLDPLELLGLPPKPVPPASTADQGQEVFTPYAPPVARPDPGLAPKIEPVAPLATPAAPVERGVAEAPPAHPSVGSRREAESGELLRAFLEGAGSPGAKLPDGLTPETMEKVGTLLRAAVRGTLDLLRARALTKSELRLDLTAITPRDNNPLKLSPTPEAALLHLLNPQVPGFMDPVPAMQEAYDDLRAHQLGFLAGMRAALDDVLARFAPDELEKRLADPSMLDSMLSMHRKAKQWDLFVERYEDIAGQVRDDFNAILGKSFRRAYEAQIKELRSEGRQR